MIEFDIPAISCGHCAGMVTKTVQSLDPQARVEVDLATKKVRIETTGERGAIAAALSEAGYPPA